MSRCHACHEGNDDEFLAENHFVEEGVVSGLSVIIGSRKQDLILVLRCIKEREKKEGKWDLPALSYGGKTSYLNIRLSLRRSNPDSRDM
jgi:hypothetical protein